MNIPDLERILIDPNATVRPTDLVNRRLGDVQMSDLINAAAQDQQQGEETPGQAMSILEETPDGADGSYI